jgi:hypothetical protein
MLLRLAPDVTEYCSSEQSLLPITEKRKPAKPQNRFRLFSLITYVDSYINTDQAFISSHPPIPSLISNKIAQVRYAHAGQPIPKHPTNPAIHFEPKVSNSKQRCSRTHNRTGSLSLKKAEETTGEQADRGKRKKKSRRRPNNQIGEQSQQIILRKAKRETRQKDQSRTAALEAPMKT